jgi:hypothetical protein
MELLFLPPVALRTVHTFGAATIFDAFDVFVLLPVGTLYGFVMILFWVSSVILNVVGIYTH